jgi:hypothetical protein
MVTQVTLLFQCSSAYSLTLIFGAIFRVRLGARCIIIHFVSNLALTS